MRDNAALLAEFLIELGPHFAEEDIGGEIMELIPGITDEEFFRGFAIAKELLITDIEIATKHPGLRRDKRMLSAQYAMIRDFKPK